MLSKYDLFADMDEKDKIYHLVVKESNKTMYMQVMITKMHIDFKTLCNNVVNKTCK